MNKMFSNIVKDFGSVYDVNVLSTDPWVVTFDNFLTDSEAVALIQTVNKWERSTDTGTSNEFGETGGWDIIITFLFFSFFFFFSINVCVFLRLSDWLLIISHSTLSLSHFVVSFSVVWPSTYSTRMCVLYSGLHLRMLLRSSSPQTSVKIFNFLFHGQNVFLIILFEKCVHTCVRALHFLQEEFCLLGVRHRTHGAMMNVLRWGREGFLKITKLKRILFFQLFWMIIIALFICSFNVYEL